MPCNSVALPGGGVAILCTKGRRSTPCALCRAPHTRLCDHPVGPGKPCDRRLCDEHAVSVGPDRDLCPEHHRATTAPRPAPATRLTVFTARLNYADPARLDITRAGNDPIGVAFAPTESLLRPAKDRLRVAEELRRQAGDLFAASGRGPALFEEADRIEADVWATYEPAYMAEMRVSFGLTVEKWGPAERQAFERGARPRRDAWLEVLGRERVVGVCFCVLPPAPAPQRCHRPIWAGILAKLGAMDGGELGSGKRGSA